MAENGQILKTQFCRLVTLVVASSSYSSFSLQMEEQSFAKKLPQRNVKFESLGSILCFPTSVTSFGEISPLWQNLKSFWQLIESLFSIEHTDWFLAEPEMTNIVCHWAKFLFV